MLLVESSRSSGRGLLLGIVNYVRSHEPWSFLWEPRGLQQPITLDRWYPDGIILRDCERLEEMLSYHVPTIVVGHHKERVPGVANIITDSENIGRMAAEHLLGCGFRAFAFCGFSNRPWSVARKRAFQSRIEQDGFPVSVYESEENGVGQRQAELTRLAEWLSGLAGPIGVMGCNDDRAGQVIEACKFSGLRIPDEVAVIGADNDELVCDLADPPLSSIAINFERAGYEAAGVLARLMARQDVSQLQISVHPSHVVVRRSTNVTAIDDPHLAKALQYIRNNARGPIQVDDVVRASALSRRVLEKRFRTALRKSILQEIKRVRVTEISRLLGETHTSILQIAVSMGFTGVEHIARYFKAETGMTPSEYRRHFGRV